jgi:hypothetical protein
MIAGLNTKSQATLTTFHSRILNNHLTRLKLNLTGFLLSLVAVIYLTK